MNTNTNNISTQLLVVSKSQQILQGWALLGTLILFVMSRDITSESGSINNGWVLIRLMPRTFVQQRDVSALATQLAPSSHNVSVYWFAAVTNQVCSYSTALVASNWYQC